MLCCAVVGGGRWEVVGGGGMCGNFDIIFIILNPFSRISQLRSTPARAVCYALLRAHADRVLIGACNPAL